MQSRTHGRHGAETRLTADVTADCDCRLDWRLTTELTTDCFVLRMSLREFRASWRRLLFFFLCVAIGVGAIVALRSIIQSLRTG